MKPYFLRPLNTFSLMMIFAVAILGLVGQSRASETESVYTSEECIQCHQEGSEESELLISHKNFEASVHGSEMSCLDCHTGVMDDDHQSTEGSGAVDCSACHEQEDQHGINSPLEKRPQCYDCHTKHNILVKTDPASTVHPSQLSTTCAGCHPSASGETDFFSWMPTFRIATHNKADFGAAYENDNCLGCHQGAAAHGETDPINEQDCYKCHLSPESAGAMWGYMHPKADMTTQPVVFAAAAINQAFAIIVIIVLLIRFFRIRFGTGSRKTGVN